MKKKKWYYFFYFLTGKGHNFPLTFTAILGGKQSSCSHEVSCKQNRICTCNTHN